MRHTLTFLVLALLAGAGGYFAYQWQPGAAPALHGTAAPALRMNDLEGKPQTLEAYKGRWVLLNFWASWCAPCMDELPHLVAAQAQYGARGLQILGPALDEADAVKPLVRRFGINYPVMPDFVGADTAMRTLGNEKAALPYSVLVDPAGRVADTVLGALDADSLERLIRKHLGG